METLVILSACSTPMTGAASLRTGSSKRASTPGISCAFPNARRQPWWSFFLYPAGHGAVYRFPLVAGQVSLHSHNGHRDPSHPQFGPAWWRRHRALESALTRRKPRQDHRLSRTSLWHFLSCRICHFDPCASPSPPRRSRLSTGRSSTFWPESLILISKRQIITLIIPFSQPWSCASFLTEPVAAVGASHFLQ